jgi:hypothetical protein
MAAEWKPVLEVVVAIECLCDELQAIYAKWTRKPLSSTSARMDCRDQMLMLGQIANDTSWAYSDLAKSWRSRPVTTPKAGAAKAAFEVCESFSVGLLLTELHAKLERVTRLLAEPYSSALQDRIDLDFGELQKIRLSLSTIAKAARRTVQDVASGSSLPIKVKESLAGVCKSLNKLILESSAGETDDQDFAARFEQRLAGYTDSLKSLADDYAMLRVNVLEVFEADSGKSLGKRSKDDLEFLLEKVEEARLIAGNIRRLSRIAMERAISIDPRLDTMAAKLRDALKRAEAAEELLGNELDHWRKLLARAPYRNRLRRRPLPEWEDLSAKEQQVVATLVRLREGDPDGVYFAATQAMIEATMELGVGGRASTTTWRLLRDLDEKYEIVGQHQQRGSRAVESATNWYWIAEDAFQKYRPYVAATSGTTPARTR